MILADDSKKAVLKFFKTEEKLYELWCYNPLSPLVGCAFALSSFIFKLVSQWKYLIQISIYSLYYFIYNIKLLMEIIAKNNSLPF